MQGMGGGGEDCPFEFNFDESTFKVGDTVSYRVSTMEGFPFVGTLLEVHADYVVISPGPSEPDARYRGTRESRPMVDGSEI
jgi:anthranilate/para-aminobenzoate synthase component II